VAINDTPKFLVCNKTDRMHVLTIKDPNNPAQAVILSLALQGMTLLLNVRALTLDKCNNKAFYTALFDLQIPDLGPNLDSL
jgi:hypothetical protein